MTGREWRRVGWDLTLRARPRYPPAMSAALLPPALPLLDLATAAAVDRGGGMIGREWRQAGWDSFRQSHRLDCGDDRLHSRCDAHGA